MRYVTQHLLFGLLLAAGLVVVAPGEASAAGCNLDNDIGAYDCSVAGGYFDVTFTQPTGTGVVDSFLRVQMKGTEEAFNTDARPIYCAVGDECDVYKTDLNFTRTLLSTQVPITTINGQDYLTFYLDVNEEAAGYKQFITLDQLRIYASNVDDENLLTDLPGESSLIFNLDSGGPDNWINLDYGLVGGGSGAGDMVAYIPVKDALSYQYIYLYSQFGCTTGCSNSANMNDTKKYVTGAGFEEWWVPKGTNNGGGGGLSAVPEPGTIGLLATGLAYAFGSRRRRRRN